MSVEDFTTYTQENFLDISFGFCGTQFPLNIYTGNYTTEDKTLVSVSRCIHKSQCVPDSSSIQNFYVTSSLEMSLNEFDLQLGQVEQKNAKF